MAAACCKLASVICLAKLARRLLAGICSTPKALMKVTRQRQSAACSWKLLCCMMRACHAAMATSASTSLASWCQLQVKAVVMPGAGLAGARRPCTLLPAYGAAGSHGDDALRARSVELLWLAYNLQRRTCSAVSQEATELLVPGARGPMALAQSA